MTFIIRRAIHSNLSIPWMPFIGRRPLFITAFGAIACSMKWYWTGIGMYYGRILEKKSYCTSNSITRMRSHPFRWLSHPLQSRLILSQKTNTISHSKKSGSSSPKGQPSELIIMIQPEKSVMAMTFWKHKSNNLTIVEKSGWMARMRLENKSCPH